MLVYFNLKCQDGSKKKFKLKNGEFVTVGRGSKSVIQIDDGLASGLHCKIYIKKNEIFFEDTKSKNGSSVNGVKVTKQQLFLDDVVKVGNTIISIDIAKLDVETRRLLVYKGDKNRVEGSITLHLESVTEAKKKLSAGRRGQLSSDKQKDFVKKSKLYKDSLENSTKGDLQKRLMIERLVPIINFAFVVFVFFIPLAASYFLESHIWNKPSFSLTALWGDLSQYSIAGISASLLLSAFNKRSSKGSIAERILRL